MADKKLRLQYIESWIVGGGMGEKEDMPVICFLCRPSGYIGNTVSTLTSSGILETNPRICKQ